MNDPIIAELWKVKDGLAKECGYDLCKLFARLKNAQKLGKYSVVNRIKLRTPVEEHVVETATTYPVN